MATAWPAEAWRDVHVGVAVSGGADSVALLRALAAQKAVAGGRGDLRVIHYDHAARESSADDARFVIDLAGELGLPLQVGRSARTGPRSEEALREDRRAFFRDVAGQRGLRHFATGHHADDQAETVLFRLLRGSGLDGLAGVRPVARLTEACMLVRPMLGVRREEARDYLRSIGQRWREDATNDDTAATRNWMRHEVLPLVESRYPDATEAVARFAAEARAAGALLDGLADELLSRADATLTLAEVSLELGPLVDAPDLLATTAIRQLWRRADWPEQAMTREHWQSIVRVARGGPPADLPAGFRAEVRGERLVLLDRRC